MCAMSPRLLRPKASPFLLDQYGGAAAAYSLRRLRKGYTGAAVRVRRSSDNDEANFTPEEIANGTLTSWIGASSGRVVTWFDQSGNGRNVTQGTAENQPRIVISGSLVTESGKPAIDFLVTSPQSLGFSGSSIPSLSTFSQFVISKVRDNNNSVKFAAMLGKSTTAAGAGFSYNGSESPRLFIWGATPEPAGPNDSLSRLLLSSVVNGTAMSFFINDGSVISGTSSQSLAIANDSFRIGDSDNLIGRFDGTIQEVIVYFSDQTTARPNIRNAINSHYGIY